MSDTPRMKAAQRIESECKVKEIWRVGCQLERELNAANDRIKRLEEAGDTMASAYRQICYDAYDDQQIDNWLKAKEEKA